MSNLVSFLTDLAVDTKKQKMFAHNPQAFLEVTGLSKNEQLVIKQGSSASLIAALADDLLIDDLAAVMGSCYILDPGPDPSPDPDPPPDED